MILTVQSTTFGAYGGIPAYNRLVCRVLNEISQSERPDVLIATDTVSDIEGPSLELPNLELHAFDRNRVALIARVMSVALRKNINVALIGHINYSPLAWILKRFRPQLRYGVMLYGIEAWQKLPLLRRHALQEANFVISISEYTKQRAVEANALIAERVYVLPNALEWANVESIRTTQPPKPAGTRLLSVCRLERAERYKGVDKVIEALPEIAKSVPDIHYTVVGDGTDLARHKDLAEKLAVGGLVTFLGNTSDEALRACYDNCDVFVMPSAGEGFGFVFLEAMKYAKPIVAANTGGAPEVVANGFTGHLVEYGNKQQLTQALIDLCLDPIKRRRLGQAGYKRLQENFTFSHFKQKLSQIILQELPPERSSKVHLDSNEAPQIP